MTAADLWQQGADAFARGELPPANPDAAEGWYWAENAAALAGRAARTVAAAATRAALLGGTIFLVTLAHGALT